MKTVLITGGNGFLGSNLIKCLVNDYKIIVIEKNVQNLYRLKRVKRRVQIFDIDQIDLNSIFRDNKLDAVIHTATIYSSQIEFINELIQSNVLLPVKLISLCEKWNVPYLINTDSFFNSSQSVEYEYLSEYTLSKRQALEWMKVLQRTTKIINMKIFHMYGPGDSDKKFVSQIINQLKMNVDSIDLTLGEQKRDFIYIDDIVSAYKIVLENLLKHDQKFYEYEVGTGKSISIRDFVNLASEIINSRSKLAFGRLPYRKGEMMNSFACNQPLKELGWKTQYSDIKDGLDKICKYI